jgi:VanZ family protein
MIGNEYTGDRLWQGKIFLVGLYNRALGDEEIFQNYKDVRSSDTTVIGSRQNHNGLVRLYTFSEGKGNVVYNRTEAMASGNLVPQNLSMNSLKEFSLRFNFQHMLSNLHDVLLNIVGFIPLSLIVFINTSKHGSLLSNIYSRPILVGLIASIFLEFMQIFSTTRFPGILDIMCNLLGTIIGSIILHFSWTLMGRKRLLNNP